MGNASTSCAPCPTAVTGSVINLSDGLVVRLTEGHDLQEDRYASVDNDWFEKLKCLDESHSQVYDLNMEGFDKLMNKIEKRMKELGTLEVCEKENVIKCLKNNSECSLNCVKEVGKFIDCIDMHRLQIIKKRYTESKIKK